MRTEEFDFHLPPGLIAQHPVLPRDHSRLMMVDRLAGEISHHRFDDLPDRLRSGDLLVRNDSLVLRARIRGRREATGGAWEGLYLRTVGAGFWQILAKTRGKPMLGERFLIGDRLVLTLVKMLGEGRWLVDPADPRAAVEVLAEVGEPPLPPYIRKGRAESRDRDHYQTVHAREPGSVAAPTAGLHFTPELWGRLHDQGIDAVDLTLHVGIGTFRPIETATIDEHVMHAEWAELDESAACRLNQARIEGHRLIAVGTTSARTLESAARDDAIHPMRSETAIYLKPGHRFRAVDALITNFHLPRSSLFVLVSAFGGIELMRNAYREAIREEYRFYSYGDAMIII